MGFNTTVVILNDRLGEIEDNPKRFVDELTNAIHFCGAGLGDLRTQPFVTGQSQVVGTHHASGNHIVSVGGNAGVSLGFVNGVPNRGTEESNLEIIRQLADKYGYYLRKKPRKHSGRQGS